MPIDGSGETAWILGIVGFCGMEGNLCRAGSEDAIVALRLGHFEEIHEVRTDDLRAGFEIVLNALRPRFHFLRPWPQPTAGKGVPKWEQHNILN